jgi:signal transduction histidine kinase
LFPESTALGVNSLSIENQRQLEAALEDNSSTTELDLNGQVYIAQIRSLEGGLLLVSILPKEELTRAGRALGTNVLIIAVFAILITLACKLLILTSFITNPLKRLGAGAERIQAGDLDVAIQLKGHNELTDLGQKFNAMAHSLKESGRLRDQAQAEALENKELAIASLKKADQLKDDFLANTSHELRTPLHGMTGIAESLLNGAAGSLNENVVANLKLIVAGGKRLSHLVNDILDFSKLRHGELKLNLHPVDIQSICRLVLTTLQPTMATRDIALKMDIADDLPLVLVDENRLQQIFYNIVGNAIKFMESGEVAINASVKGEQIEIAVSDTGKGIPEDKLESIFDSFLQLDSAADRTQGGTGLGLTITRKLVQYHGGDIWVRSKVGRGTTVFFTMPITTGSAEPDSNVDVKSAPGHAASPLVLDPPLADILPQKSLCQVDGAGKIIWVVDDEPMNQQVVENHLIPCGFSVQKASGGQEVLEMLNAPEHRPDLVLLDVMMPRMNGFEVCEHIRKEYSASELPVIFLTARNRPEDIVYGVRAGANDYIPKPFSRDEIIARMKIHLDLADSNRQLRQWTETLEERVKERTGLLEQANLELEKQNEILKDNQDLREEIEHITQHDLRSPISGIIGLAELLLENDPTESLASDLKMIIESGYLALDMIGRSLSMLKIERGVYALKRDEFNLIALVNQVIRDTASLQSSKGVGVRVFVNGSRVQEEASFRIKAEKGLLYSVFSNLIGNALEATKEAKDVEVAIESSDSNTKVCIHNAGVVPDEIRDRFFEKYATAGKPDGNGLGTYSARLIVEYHGGSISFTSSKEAGTHLKIVLPNPD